MPMQRNSGTAFDAPFILALAAVLFLFGACTVQAGEKAPIDLNKIRNPILDPRDLVHWEKPRRITPLDHDFWSPGNVIRAGAEWVLCMQTYPIEPREKNAGESCRLWIVKSRDPRTWSNGVTSIMPNFQEENG